MTQPMLICPQCGRSQAANALSCTACGSPIRPLQSGPNTLIPGQMQISPYAPYGQVPAYQSGSSNKVAAGVCGILLGALGVHKFILGKTTAGVIMLLASLLSFGLLAPIMGVIGLVEGIVYLTKSDQEFYQTYVVGRKDWF